MAQHISYERLGCDTYVKRTESDKFETKFDNYIFVDIQEIIGYQFYNLVEKKMFISRHVVLLEKVFTLRETVGVE